MSWLEVAYMPEDITDGDEEEDVQIKIEAWLDAHEQARQTSGVSWELDTLKKLGDSSFF